QMARESLEERYAQLNPVLLRRRIEELENHLLGSVRSKGSAPLPHLKLRPRSVTVLNDLARRLKTIPTRPRSSSHHPDGSESTLRQPPVQRVRGRAEG
ncbi:MAG: hypothetical protein ACP5U2_10460, partial [Bryobacteraceae bacterium]